VAVPDTQQETAALLERLAGAPAIETHISLVFAGADTVWKLKKAVHLPFLDFTRVEDRHHFIARELELNAPAAPGLYRDVAPVVRGAEGLALGGEGPVVDWVLRMARVPKGDFLDVMAANGRLTSARLDEVADAVAAYHGRLSPRSGVVPPMRDIARGNAESARAAGLPEPEIAAWLTAMLSRLDGLSTWMNQRARAGFVRRAHGDLHLGNLCLWQDRPAPFDALEFDEAMATIDLGYDLAFLLMDLDRRLDRGAANRVLNRYIARNGDVGLLRGLPAFLSMRAMIRAHVEARTGHCDRAVGYLEAARAYLEPPAPRVIAIGGLPGTGKSTLARALAPGIGAASGALVLRSDELRKRRFGVAPEQRLPPDAYADAVSQGVFADLFQAAADAVSAGHAVIADATFLDPAHRTAIAAAAGHVPFQGFWLQAPLPVLEARVGARRGDASDATVEVLRRAAPSDPGPSDWTAIDATDPDAALDAIRRAQNWK
jgi:aminoglycoside phosphotransferase family enzyme/predicted kinase